MKKLVAFLIVGMFVMSGCGPKGTRGGGAAKGKGFTLALKGIPNPLGIKVKRGETKALKITLKREKEMEDDVDVTVAADEELKVTPDKWSYTKGEVNQDVDVKVTDKAEAKKEYTITFTGKAKSGDPSELKVTIKVVPK